jgi:hypothetical protein
VQGLGGSPGQFTIGGDQVERPGDLARDDDLVFAQPALQCPLGGVERRDHQTLVHDLLGGLAEVSIGVLLHPGHHQLLIEGASVDADANGPVVLDRYLDDRGEIFVAAPTVTDIAGIDPVLVERPRAVGELGQQLVPVVVEVADQGHIAAPIEQALLDLGHRARGLGHVDRDAHQLRARLGELPALLHRRGDIRRIGVRHRLHDDRRAAAHVDRSHPNLDRAVSHDRKQHSILP